MKTQNVIVVVIVILLGANILAWLVVFELAKPQYLEVTFFDVGQGDSIFIETPQRNQILIDGGPTPAVLERLDKEMPFWDRTIDLVILTHPEQDHIAGLIEVLKSYKVENVLWTGVVRDTAEYREWREVLSKEGANIFIARAGLKIVCAACKFQRWELDILHPFDNLAGKEVGQSNNTSVVARLISGKISFLFTGDIEKSVERELVQNSVALQADVLKVAHHGSKTSTSPEFVSVISPEFAVISVGRDNRYGHPHSQTIETLQKYAITTLRTDQNGDIKFLTDGKSFRLK